MTTLNRANDRPICIAIFAIGGQGGGVLADWIVATAEANNWFAQATSVPGVAQRTGATVYYVEVFPNLGRPPVLALMPTPGEVDVVLAAEFLESGRAILRGFCTRERTTLICSTHRSYAIGEKAVPGNGVIDPTRVIEAIRRQTARVVALDMASIAESNGSVISAVMLGALAASNALPYARGSFEDAIRAGGVGVNASLRAFNQAFADVESGVDGLAALEAAEAEASEAHVSEVLPTIRHPAFAELVQKALTEFPETTRSMLAIGMRRVADYQDLGYVNEYLKKMRQVLTWDRTAGGLSRGFSLTGEAARQIAVGMAHHDVIRVADLKIRSSRFARIQKEVGTKASQVLYVTEFMHPGVAEVLGTLPRALGTWIEKRPRLCAALDRLVNKGRRVHTNKIGGFVALSLVAGMRRFRRRTLGHDREMQRLDRWLAQVERAAASDYGLAVEIVKNRRLVKGYSETHDRGNRKFQQVMDAAGQLMGHRDAADWVRRLREAALADEEGTALAKLIRASPVGHG
jgi:indolepyruvate ferredoxin oxidoreductase beta subunit